MRDPLTVRWIARVEVKSPALPRSFVRVSNPEQVAQPEQARLSRDGVRMRYRRERRIRGIDGTHALKDRFDPGP